MRFSKALLVAALMALTFVPLESSAFFCWTTYVEVPLGVTTLYYVDDSDFAPVPGIVVGVVGLGDGSNATWVYMESNGEAGLQRGGEHSLLGYGDSACGGSTNPDRMLL